MKVNLPLSFMSEYGQIYQLLLIQQVLVEPEDWDNDGTSGRSKEVRGRNYFRGK